MALWVRENVAIIVRFRKRLRIEFHSFHHGVWIGIRSPTPWPSIERSGFIGSRSHSLSRKPSCLGRGQSFLPDAPQIVTCDFS